MKTILLTFSLIILLALAYRSVEPDVPMFADSSAFSDKLTDTSVYRDDESALATKQHLTGKVAATPRLIELTPDIIERANQIYTSVMQHRASTSLTNIQTTESSKVELDESTATAAEFSRLTEENQRLYDAIQASTNK